MMKFAVAALIAGSATAFVPSKASRDAVMTLMAFEDEIGAQAPLGLFDPLGLVRDGDEDKFNRLRYVELKHGRIALTIRDRKASVVAVEK